MGAPSRLGPYRIVRRLGRGGMAEVFLAKAFGASGFEKWVALKTLLPELRGDGDLERLLIEEALLGARLSHRNLVGVHELGVDDGTYYVRMDYVDGADVASLLATDRLAAPLALLVVEEVALALAYVHSARDERDRPLGLVHRDVSPQNVLVSRSGEVKLGDFGIAKATHLASEVTQGHLRRGKYAYMSPEQIDGVALTAHSDQFGLGVMLCELLLGARPFDAETPYETMERIRRAEPPAMLAALAPDLATLVTRMLAREPSARFATTEELVVAIGEARRIRPPTSLLDLAAAWNRARTSSPPYVRPTTRPLTE